jgi:hypothetical protein
MSTLETQYRKYKEMNKDSNFTFDEWMENILIPTFQKYPTDDFKVWDVTLLDGLEFEEKNERK